MKKVLAVMMAGLLLCACTSESGSGETPKETAAPVPAETEETVIVSVPEDVLGTWYEPKAGRGVLDITANEDGTANAEIVWSNSAFETNVWEMVLTYSPETSTLDYMNGTKTVLNFEKGNDPEKTVVYDDGAGSFDILDDRLVWHDGYAEVPGDTTDFVREENVMSGQGMPNPWTATTDLDEAMEISGIWFMPPVMLFRDLEFETYMAAEGTIDARYTNGKDTLVVRKSTAAEGQELSGDYTTYSTTWDQVLKGLRVTCRGDGKLLNEGIFSVDDTHWAISFNAGEEGNGMTPDELNTLVNGMQ